MSGHSEKFRASAADLLRFVDENPLAWVVSLSGSEFASTLLPLRPVVDAAGQITELRGHFARTNAHVETIRGQGRAVALFLGPHGYVSPSWMSDRTQAPTWVYTSAQFDLDISLLEEDVARDDTLRDLVHAMEQTRPAAWSLEEMGSRYRRLASGVVAFRARVIAQRSKFKLGQDERDDVFRDITSALDASGARELLEWMQRCNHRMPGAG